MLPCKEGQGWLSYLGKTVLIECLSIKDLIWGRFSEAESGTYSNLYTLP